MSDTLTVGKKLVELCREDKHFEAMELLYHPQIVSIEAASGPNMPARMEGVEATKAKGKWWVENHEIHKAEIEGPFPHGDRFIVRYKYELTAKSGPMAGKRFVMDEAALIPLRTGRLRTRNFSTRWGSLSTGRKMGTDRMRRLATLEQR
jgi:hypothetical protein